MPGYWNVGYQSQDTGDYGWTSAGGDNDPGGIDTSWHDPNDPQTILDIGALEALTPVGTDDPNAIQSTYTAPPGGLTLAQQLAGVAAEDPKYGFSWEGQQGYAPNTLGQFIATDWQGNPILDSSGNVMWTGLGQSIMEQHGSNMNLDPEGNVDYTLEGLQGLEQQYFDTLTAQEQFENQQQQYGYGYDPGGGGGYAGGPGGGIDVKRFSRGRPENINPWWQNIAGTPMLPVAGSGAGGSLATRDILTQLAAGAKAFSRTPEEQGILALLNA